MNSKRAFLKILFSEVVLISFLMGAGQQQPSIIPPSPEAASFFKSTDIPVSMYTGLPNIGVDFYTIKTRELQIPIRISYNARGIQVAELASRVGIGWSLGFGGMISRQIRGLADESPFGILNHNYYNEVFTSSAARGALMADIVNQDIDEYPDQFYFDMNGENGKFTIDHNDDAVVLQKFDDISIVPTITFEGIVAWTVTDKLGNKYYYGRTKDGAREAIDQDLADQSFSFSNFHGMTQLGSNQDRPKNAWHLMEIETYLHERIEFLYEAEEGIHFQRSYDKVQKTSGEDEEISYFSKLYTNQYQIKEIRFPGGKVLFENETAERKDFTNTYALHKISVVNDKGLLIKQYEFNYFYQRCKDDNNQLDYLKQIDAAANYRLFLASIKEKSSSGDSLPPYRFDYDSVLLPNRFSNSQDNWGYYNAKNNGRYLTFFSYGSPLISREVNPDVSGAGLLKKITYPTGGTTSFIYEQNRLIPPAFINSLLFNPTNPTDTMVVSDGFLKKSIYYSNEIYSKIITIDTLLPFHSVRFSFSLPWVGSVSDPSILNYQVILSSLNGTASYYLYPPNASLQFNPLPGQYLLQVIPPANHDTSDFQNSFFVNLKWTVRSRPVYENIPLAAGEWFGAGKRIKRIEQRSGNDLVSFREYEYLDSNGKSSGKMLGLPAFHSINKVWAINGGSPQIDGWGTISGSPLALLQGNAMGYSRVTEYFGDHNNNQGKSVYEFTNDEDGGSYYQYPYPIPIDFEWLRGKPLTTKIYKRNGATYELQKSIENTYLYAGVANTPNLFAQPFIHEGSAYEYRKDRNLYYLPLLTFSSPGTATTPPDYEIYYQSAGSFDLQTTTEKEFANGTVLTRKVRYTYNYPKHYLQASQRSRTSKGDSSVSITYYAPDLNVRTAAEQKLIDQNRIAIPVQVNDSIKNSSGIPLASMVKKTGFKDWGQNIVLPGSLQTSINNSPFFTELTYNKYDADGLPVELTPRTGVKQTFIWDYNKLYPVAQCLNADSNSVAYTSFEAEGTGNWFGVDPNYIQSAGGITGDKYYAQTGFTLSRSGLNSAHFYIVSYWSKNGSYSVGGTQSGYPKAVSRISSGSGLWTLYEHLVTGQSTITVSSSGTSSIDELRLYPRQAMMSTYTYVPLIGISSLSDASGRITYYEYDSFGRLKLIRDQNQNILKKYEYKYASR